MPTMHWPTRSESFTRIDVAARPFAFPGLLCHITLLRGSYPFGMSLVRSAELGIGVVVGHPSQEDRPDPSRPPLRPRPAEECQGSVTLVR